MMKITILRMTLIATILSCSLFRSPPPAGSPVPLGFDLEELLIDIPSLLPGWQAGEVLSDDGKDDMHLDLGQQSNRYIRSTKEASGFVADHEVYLYSNKESAEYWYGYNLSRQFHNANRVTPWETPPELNYQSRVADQFQFECAIFQYSTDDGSKRFTECVMVGQYDRVISAFSTDISPETMSYADLERILKAIDERMATYLELQ